MGGTRSPSKTNILFDWKNLNFRNRKYVNFKFGNENLIENPIINLLELSSMEPDLILPDTKNYFKKGYENITNVLDFILEDEEDIQVYFENNETTDVGILTLQGNNFEILESILKQNIIKHEDDILNGISESSTKKENIYKLIYSYIISEHKNMFENDEEFIKNAIFHRMIFYLPKKRLFFYVHDLRDGFLYSEYEDDKKYLMEVFTKFSKILNFEYANDMLERFGIWIYFCSSLGIKLIEEGKYKESLGHYEELYNFIKNFDDDDLKNLSMTEYLFEFYYNYACASCHCKKIDDCFKYLKKSISYRPEVVFMDKSELFDYDKDFKSVKNHPEMENILKLAYLPNNKFALNCHSNETTSCWIYEVAEFDKEIDYDKNIVPEYGTCSKCGKKSKLFYEGSFNDIYGRFDYHEFSLMGENHYKDIKKTYVVLLELREMLICKDQNEEIDSKFEKYKFPRVKFKKGEKAIKNYVNFLEKEIVKYKKTIDEYESSNLFLPIQN